MSDLRTTFVIISVSDRLADLNALLDQLVGDMRWQSYHINLLFQDPAGVAKQIRHQDQIAQLIVVPEKLGCHGARVTLLRELDYEAYVNLDDDMMLGPWTNYEGAIRKANEPDTGFVITNWARTPALLEKKLPLDESFRKQILVYNGGGMAYTEKIAKLMRELPIVKTAFDLAWPLTAYLEGFTNYYYYGSLAVHRVCATGGMHTFMAETPLHVMMSEWVRLTPTVKQRGNCHDVRIPLDADVLPAARVRHRMRRAERFGTL